MKQQFFFLLFFITASLALIMGCATTAVDSEKTMTTSGPKQRIAVLEFKDESTYTYGRRPRFDATEFMEQALASSGRFTVIPRKEWKQIRDTTTLPEQTETDVIQQAVRFGKTIGADLVFLGVIYNFNVENEAIAGSTFSMQYEHSSTAHTKASVIDVASGQVIFKQNVTGSATRRTAMTAMAYEDIIIRESLKDAARQLSSKIAKQI